MKRRTFIKQSVAATAFVTASSYGLTALASPSQKHLTILHTNDTHSHIDPFPESDPRNANRGGVARRATLIEQIRQENPNTLLFDAGDIFQGTPYFNFYGGELEFKLMSMMKYDAATIGNHEFDNGIEGLYAQMPHAGFDFVISNYDFSNTLMDGLTKPYKIIEKNGIKTGVFGLGIELDGLVTKSMYKETVYLNPVEITQDMVKTFREEKKCDLVICLSHIGYEYRSNRISDIRLAQQTSGIDLIIGGHTHTFLPKPVIVQNKEGKDTLINQVGFGGINLGRIDFYFEDKKKVTSQGATIVV